MLLLWWVMQDKSQPESFYFGRSFWITSCDFRKVSYRYSCVTLSLRIPTLIIFIVSTSIRVHEGPSFLLQLISKVFLVHAAQRHLFIVQVVHIWCIWVRVLWCLLPFFTLHVTEEEEKMMKKRGLWKCEDKSPTTVKYQEYVPTLKCSRSEEEKF